MKLSKKILYSFLILLFSGVTTIATVIMCSRTGEKNKETIESNSNGGKNYIPTETQETHELDTTKIQDLNKVFSVKNIRTFDEITTFIEFQLIGSDIARNIRVRVSDYGICRIQNEYRFPIHELERDELFEVELARKVFNNMGNVRISIDWYESDGRHREIKEVDIIERKEIEIE